MLQSLSVRDVLLIQHLELDFHSNLTALTGETGAGKSILLDCLGLALGERGNSALVRTGALQASITAVFHQSERTKKILRELGIPIEKDLIIRRSLAEDGRSKSYINDELISINSLKKVSESLVEIHGQFDHLLDPATHREAVDRYGNLKEDVQRVEQAYTRWKQAKAHYGSIQAEIEKLKYNHEFLKLAVEELTRLAPEEGEEERRVEERAFLANKAKLVEAVEKALALLTKEGGVESLNNTAYRTLERIAPQGLGKIEPILEILDRVGNEAREAVQLLHSFYNEKGGEAHRLEDIENRLYELRGMARKYSCAVLELPQLARRFQADLSKIDLSATHLKELEIALREAEEDYRKQAQLLSQKRREIAEKLAGLVNEELKPLKLETARFYVEVSHQQAEEGFTPHGSDKIEFQVQTNPGSPKGPLRKIASGGERSRFMLALKVVMAGQESIPTLIFDEIDAGVGGAVASAIGERLKKLSKSSQILVVTHSPQVASFGDHHLKIQKESAGSMTVTSVTELNFLERREEIARMLAGKQITDEARAAADQLLAPLRVA